MSKDRVKINFCIWRLGIETKNKDVANLQSVAISGARKKLLMTIVLSYNQQRKESQIIAYDGALAAVIHEINIENDHNNFDCGR